MADLVGRLNTAADAEERSGRSKAANAEDFRQWGLPNQQRTLRREADRHAATAALLRAIARRADEVLDSMPRTGDAAAILAGCIPGYSEAAVLADTINGEDKT